jgi:2-C-methyl-D-erythritol 4-phosphate cytidylyltransferase
MYVSAIVAGAGKGVRLGSKTPKALSRLNARPLIIYSLQALQKHPLIKEIVVVVNPDFRKTAVSRIKKYRITKVTRVVNGGSRRQDSVYQGLEATDARADLVLIHDACRPFVDKKMISGTIKEAKTSGAAIAAVPVKATIKSVVRIPSSVVRKFVVEKTLSREGLWEIQTPQVFKKELILKAYKKFGKHDVTDDAMLVEKLGRKVGVVFGSYDNIKITTPEDLIFAKAILKG